MVNSIFIRSFFTGFFAACMVGPVFTLVLYRAVTGGYKDGIVSALGTALADGTFFFLAAISGISAGQNWLSQIKAFEMIGGPLMIAFGLWTLIRRSSSQQQEATAVTFGPQQVWLAVSTMLLTLSNPLTLIFFGSVAAHLFPDISFWSWKQILMASSFLSIGSFSLLLIAIICTKWQRSINPDSLVKFLKTLSGTTLLLTGGLLTFEYWMPFKIRQKDKAPFALIKK